MQYRNGMGALALATLLAIGATSASAATYVTTVVASGLDNPRGITFGPDGALYIAEGGTFNPGGATMPDPDGGTLEYGTSGAITRVAGGVQTRIVTGLPSLTNPATSAATGPQGISFFDGTGYVVVGLGADPATALGGGAGAANLATLFSFGLDGSVTPVADLGAWEAANNPAGGPLDSNPYHLAAGPAGLLVTDAGGNDLLGVGADGAISTIASFPTLGGIEPVPTGVAVGPDGAFYVGQLTGVPFPPGGADIFRIDPATGATSIYETGFTNITDIAWAPDGSLYVLQFADAGIFAGGPGSVIRIAPGGAQSTVVGGLTAPTGLDVGPDGAVYVTNFSPVAGIGQVLRIAAVPEPASWAMLIAGFGLVGLAARKKGRARVSAG